MPNFRLACGSPYSSTNRLKPMKTVSAYQPSDADRVIAHSPRMTDVTATYMGLRVHRYGPRATSVLGGSIGAGVPSPAIAKSHTHRRYRRMPKVSGTIAAACRVRLKPDPIRNAAT